MTTAKGALRQGTLSFDARATLGPFVGTTAAVTGQMTGGPDLASVRGWVEAPATTLKTGNSLRDSDMNKSLESGKFPTLRFDLTSVTPGAPVGDATDAQLAGRLTIHGVSRDVLLPATVVREPGAVRVRSDFPLNLADYRIGGLNKMLGMLRMYPDIVVHVDVIFAA